MKRKIKRLVEGELNRDGNVKVLNVLTRDTMHDADPLLLLDAFDSTDPEDYKGGFPMHPHRGIETISYVTSGSMVHADSLGHKDECKAGGVQWMTAGSGILHEEMMPPTEHLYGVQLWLNLKKSEKWATPAYWNIKSETIPEVEFKGGRLRVLAGEYQGTAGFASPHQPVRYYDVRLDAGASLTLDMETKDAATLFALQGDVHVVGEGSDENETLPHFHAAILTEGDQLALTNPTGQETATLVFISERIDEPIAWRPGPIVMNTEEELDEAYREVEEGTFIKEKMEQ